MIMPGGFAKIGVNVLGEELFADGSGRRERRLSPGGEVRGTISSTADPGSPFYDEAFKTLEEKFIGDLAELTGKSIHALRRAGYEESIPEYIANGKTATQVANAMQAAARPEEAASQEVQYAPDLRIEEIYVMASQAGPEYCDVNVYIPVNNGVEWLYTVSKDLRANKVLDVAPPRYASTKAADLFHEGVVPPGFVGCAFKAVYQSVVDYLESIVEGGPARHVRIPFSDTQQLHAIFEAANTPGRSDSALHLFASVAASSFPAFIACASALEEARGAMGAMFTQIEQMKGMFDDSDGNIQSALDAYQVADAVAWDALEMLSPPENAEKPKGARP